ncbi:PD-(D/E)XK nuclease family protein [Nosocomiicoccus sp. HMSC09A07]|uniref:PD-(D/E)XK nuclease family protein n=1 Tax=Nosocomiicoccus sp. HMSC09A07 TaxID=1581145 RepID=UPI0008A11633|nr:PD-(D/E)XK nuclease family protein [Nosocomiicoccus sp. HMSC09A07]OFS62290.1 hypothetical protein HMPREF3177_05980 [Nosocomiicoccus sp. HMSC09A07]
MSFLNDFKIEYLSQLDLSRISLDSEYSLNSKNYIIVNEQDTFELQQQITNEYPKIGFTTYVNSVEIFLLNLKEELPNIFDNELSRDSHAYIIYSILEQNKERLNCIKDKNRDVQISLAYEFLKSINELIEYNINIDSFENIVKKLKSESLLDEIHMENLEDIHFIYSKWNQFIESHNLNSGHTIKDLITVIENTNDIDFLKNTSIYWHLSEEVLPIELELFKTLKNKQPEVKLALISNYHSDDIENNRVINYEKSIEKLKPLISEKNHLKFIETKTFEDEVSVVASEIRRLIAEKKINHLSEIEVIYQSEETLNKIKNIFKDYELPIVTDEKKTLTSHAYIKFLINLIDFHIYKESYKNVSKEHLFINMLKTNFLNDSLFKGDIKRISRFITDNNLSIEELHDSEKLFDIKYDNTYSCNRDIDYKVEAVKELKNYDDEEYYKKVYDERRKSYEATDSEETLETVGREYDPIEGVKSFVRSIYIMQHALKTVEEFKYSVLQNSSNNFATALWEYLNDSKIYEKFQGQFSYYSNNIETIEYAGDIVEESKQVNNAINNILEDLQTIQNISQYNSNEKLIKIMREKLLNTIKQEKKDNSILVEKFGERLTPQVKFRFFINLTQHELPKHIKDEVFINDFIKERFKENNYDISLDTEKRYIQNEYEFYKSIYLTHTNAYLSYSKRNLNGDDVQESLYSRSLKKDESFVLDEAAIGHNAKTITNKFLIDSNEIISDEKSFEEALQATKKHLRPEKYSAWVDIMDTVKESDEDLYNQLTTAFDFNNDEESIGSEIASELYITHELEENSNIKVIEASVSRYESYNQCSFKHFANYGLRLKAKESQEIEPKHIGTLQHDIMEIIINDVKSNISKYREIDEEQDEEQFELEIQSIRSKVSELVDVETSKIKNRIFNSTTYNIQVKTEVKRALSNAVEFTLRTLRETSFDVYALELAFGYENSNNDKDFLNVKPISEVTIENLKYRLYIKGFIDRVDIYIDENGNGFINVIDYKLGDNKLEYDKILNDQQLQMLTYMHILENNLGSQIENINLLPSAMMYYQIHSKISNYKAKIGNKSNLELLTNYRPNVFQIEKLEEYENKDLYNKPAEEDRQKYNFLTEHVLNNFKDSTKKIFSGDVSVNPKESKNSSNDLTLPCEYCDFKDACLFEKNAYKRNIRFYNEEFIRNKEEAVLDKEDSSNGN